MDAQDRPTQRSGFSRPGPIIAAVMLALVIGVPVADAERGAGGHGPQSADACERIVAVGDIHGGYDVFVEILRLAGLVDEGLEWIGGEACLVQHGDLLDRGARSPEVIALVMDLKRQAPGRVFPILGNHEVMNLVGDLRYVFPGEFAAFADEELAEDRERGFAALVAAQGENCTTDPQPGEAELRAQFDEAHPPGWFAHRKAYAPDGRFGEWLLEQPIVVQIGRSVFVHGGFSTADAALGTAKLNRRAGEEIRDYLRLREALIEEGLLSPLDSYKQSFKKVEQSLQWSAEKIGPRLSRASKKLAEEFLALRGASLFRGDGPLWNRDFAKMDEAAHADAVTSILKSLKADRVAVGHSVQGDGRIRSRFDGRVFLIDTGAGPHYGNHVSALEIVGDEVRALYPGKAAETLVPSSAVAAR